MIHFRSEVIKTAGSSASIKNKKKGGRNKKNKNKMMDLSDLTGPYPIVSPGKLMGKGVLKNSKERVVVLSESPRGHDLNRTASMSHLGARMHTNVKSALSALFLLLQSKSRLGQSAAGRDGRRRTPRHGRRALRRMFAHGTLTHSLDHSRQTPLQFTLQNRRTSEQSNFVSYFAKRSLLCYTPLHTVHRLIRFRWSP